MGEIAEMMLDGTLCQYCGELLVDPGEENCGFPDSCDSCKSEQAWKRVY